MSVLRRLYNVAYGKVRSWGSEDGLEDLAELEGGSARAKPWTGAGSVAEESVQRLREQLGRLEAEAKLEGEPARRTGGIRREAEPEAPESEAPQPVVPKQRKL